MLNTINSILCVRMCDLGQGVFASKNINKDEVILIFSGKFINLEEALAKGELSGNPMQIDTQTYMDLEPPGVLVNHSCDPNAGITSGNILIALRDIHKHEQIYYDYSTTMSENGWTLKCRCGVSNCRGTIKDFHYLPADIKAKYLELGIVQNFIVRQNNKIAVQVQTGIGNTGKASQFDTSHSNGIVIR